MITKPFNTNLWSVQTGRFLKKYLAVTFCLPQWELCMNVCVSVCHPTANGSLIMPRVSGKRDFLCCKRVSRLARKFSPHLPAALRRTQTHTHTHTFFGLHKSFLPGGWTLRSFSKQSCLFPDKRQTTCVPLFPFSHFPAATGKQHRNRKRVAQNFVCLYLCLRNVLRFVGAPFHRWAAFLFVMVGPGVFYFSCCASEFSFEAFFHGLSQPAAKVWRSVSPWRMWTNYRRILWFISLKSRHFRSRGWTLKSLNWECGKHDDVKLESLR